MNELTEHQIACNKNKARSRERFAKYAKLVEEIRDYYDLNLTPNQCDEKTRKDKLATAKSLIEYMEWHINSKMLRDYK